VLSVDREYALRIAREECSSRRLPRIESIETGDALGGRPERMVRSEQDGVPCISAHVIDQLFGITADLVGRCIDENIRIPHDTRKHFTEPGHANVAADDSQLRKFERNTIYTAPSFRTMIRRALGRLSTSELAGSRGHETMVSKLDTV
jgi:hypothetical protein